jgi:hypothetical protein
MSDLSNFLHAMENFFTKNTTAGQTVTTAAGQVGQAVTTIEQALPAIAVEAVNGVMSMLGAEGAAFEPLADAFLTEVISQLQAKISSPMAAIATPPTSVGG